jgi:hypothetical protein
MPDARAPPLRQMAALSHAAAAVAGAKGLPPPVRAELDAAVQVRSVSWAQRHSGKGPPRRALDCLSRAAQALLDANRIMLSADRDTIYLL